jgi:hypothetical protein
MLVLIPHFVEDFEIGSIPFEVGLLSFSDVALEIEILVQFFHALKYPKVTLLALF